MEWMWWESGPVNCGIVGGGLVCAVVKELFEVSEDRREGTIRMPLVV